MPTDFIGLCAAIDPTVAVTDDYMLSHAGARTKSFINYNNLNNYILVVI